MDFSDILFHASSMDQLALDWKLVWVLGISDAGLKFIIRASWSADI